MGDGTVEQLGDVDAPMLTADNNLDATVERATDEGDWTAEGGEVS